MSEFTHVFEGLKSKDPKERGSWAESFPYHRDMLTDDEAAQIAQWLIAEIVTETDASLRGSLLYALADIADHEQIPEHMLEPLRRFDASVLNRSDKITYDSILIPDED